MEITSPLTPDAALAAEIESHDFYYKIPQVRSVEFATAAGSMATLEGDVAVEVGDALMTGSEGERWPIRHREFEKTYLPHGQTRKGETGKYVSRPAIATATRLCSARVVHLPHNKGVLNGQAGDWLVTYESNDQSIVAQSIFAKTYRRVGVPVDIGISNAAAYAKPDIEAIVAQLRPLLVHTCFHIRLVDNDQSNANSNKYSLWCLIQEDAPDPDDPIPDLLTFSATAFVQARKESHSLVGFLQNLQHRDAHSNLHYIGDLLRKLARAVIPRGKHNASKETSELPAVKALAEQLFEVDYFNGKLSEFYKGKIPPGMGKYMPELGDGEPDEDEQTFWEAGAIADGIAKDRQERWQRSVFGLTKDLAERKGPFSVLLAAPFGLVQWGLLSALIFACFTEFHDGCETIDRLSFLQCDSHVWKTWVGPGSLLLYAVILLLGWLKYIALKAGKVENRHQDYRLLAEYMRVQYVWAVLGIDEHVTNAEPPAVPSESGWVVSAARALKHHATTPRNAENPPSHSRVQWAKEAFLEEQKKYHSRILIERREEAIKRVRRYGRIAVLFSILAFAVLFVFKFGTPFVAWLSHLDMSAHFLIVVMLMSLAIWAALHRVIDLYAWEIEGQRGTVVRSAIKKALNELDADEKPVRSIFVECGRFFCMDQAAWHALRRAKPIEAPGGG